MLLDDERSAIFFCQALVERRKGFNGNCCAMDVAFN